MLCSVYFFTQTGKKNTQPEAGSQKFYPAEGRRTEIFGWLNAFLRSDFKGNLTKQRYNLKIFAPAASYRYPRQLTVNKSFVVDLINIATKRRTLFF